MGSSYVKESYSAYYFLRWCANVCQSLWFGRLSDWSMLHYTKFKFSGWIVWRPLEHISGRISKNGGWERKSVWSHMSRDARVILLWHRHGTVANDKACRIVNLYVPDRLAYFSLCAQRNSKSLIDLVIPEIMKCFMVRPDPSFVQNWLDPQIGWLGGVDTENAQNLLILKSLHFQLWWIALFFLGFIEAVL